MPKESTQSARSPAKVKAAAKGDLHLASSDGAEPGGEICPKCFDSGMEVVAGKGARPCTCRAQLSHSAHLDQARLPRRYANCHFHNYKPASESQKSAFRFASQLAMQYPAVDQGLLLMGTVGVGKTHLAVSILKGLTERGFKCVFSEFGTLLKQIQDSYNANTKTSELSVLAPILNADVLVLDEVGAAKPTDWVRDTLAYIINSRYNDTRLTIFTTNYLDDRRSERDETLEDRIGVRLRSRLFEMCRTVVMTGDDYRKTFGIGR